MEQREQQAPRKAAPKEEQAQRETARTHKAPGSGWAAQALLSGAPIWDLPTRTLGELAGRVGNSGMLALASMKVSAPETRRADLAGPPSETPAFPAPRMDCLLVSPAELTTGTWPGSAFDPGGL